jgi:hypothetical protein
MKIILILVLLPCLALAQPQQSENFRIVKAVIDGGGIYAASQDFRLTSAVGQPTLSEKQSSADFSLSSGVLAPQLSVSPLSQIHDLVIQYRSPDAILHWGRSSGAQTYKIYRATDPIFTPGPLNFVGATADTFFVDVDVLILPEVRYYYNVTASSDATTLMAKTSVVARPQSVPHEMSIPMTAPKPAKTPDVPIDPAPNRAKR